ncbi:MAG: DUF1365 domain-containing protein [Solirubrobacteraceae bacterium]
MSADPGRLAAPASAIYEGSIRHRRLAERTHDFSYRLAMLYLDLDELPSLLGGRLLSRRAALVRFERGDYLRPASVPLAEAVRRRVCERTGRRPDGPIRVLTQLRSLGHCFNPVSFYYCLDERASGLEAVLAEVTNTPWGERHAYVLTSTTPGGMSGEAPASGEALVGAGEKRLHVSPFMGMDHDYGWRLTLPGETLSVEISSCRGGELAFDATLQMTRTPLTARNLNRIAVRYRASTVRTLALIYSQALRLRAKGVRARPHPARAQR